MTKDKLLRKLVEINDRDEGDPEVCHGDKDDALLQYINDALVEEEFYKGTMWCA